MRVRQLASVCCALLAITSLAACGGGDESAQVGTGPQALTVYSSVPRQGGARARSEELINGEKLALARSDGRVGPFTIKYVVLDNADPATGRWDRLLTAGNARKVVQDRTAIAYIGDLDSAASAISIPVLNLVGLLQVSPASTAVGLTRGTGEKGEPDKYYPSGRRTFGRIVPTDAVQARAQVAYQVDKGCAATFVLDDGTAYGADLARRVAADAKAGHLTIAGDATIDPQAADYRALGDEIRTAGADCVFFGGSAGDNTARLFKDLYDAIPAVRLFGSNGLADDAFARSLGRAVERVVFITDAPLSTNLYGVAGRRFIKDYRAAFGAEPGRWAAYGYEAMSVVLDAIKRAGAKGNDRQAVVDAFFATEDRNSVLGRYSIDRNGDTTRTTFGGYRIIDGRLVFDRELKG